MHVPNLPLANDPWGQSDLVDVIPINREIDERVSDQADVIRFHADPPVVFRGVTDHADLAVGPGTVWDIPSDADVKLLEWQGQAVAVGEHIERLYRTLYEVTETPRTAFGDSGRMLSGVALETELRPIVQRTLRKRAWWTRALRRRSALVLDLARQFGFRVDRVAPDPGALAADAAGRRRLGGPEPGAAGGGRAPEPPLGDGRAVSSHVMEVVERLCTHVAIMADGRIKTVGELATVTGGRDLEEVFVEVVGGRTSTGEELSWL